MGHDVTRHDVMGHDVTGHDVSRFRLNGPIKIKNK